MAVGKASDFKVYESEIVTLATEILEQESDLFNAASGGAIVLGNEVSRGNYLKQSFFTSVANLVERRDPTSSSSGTATKLAQEEEIGVKLFRRIQNENFLDAFRQIGESPEAMAEVVANQAAKAVQVNQLDSALYAAKGSIFANTNAVFDARNKVEDTQINHVNLIGAMRKFGDKALNRLGVWVMHSASYFDLVEDTITEKLYEATDFTIRTGTPQTFGKPVLVTDSDALYIAGGARDSYIVYGLATGALETIISNPMDLTIDRVTGLENLVDRYQAEWGQTVKVRGYAYQSSAGENPTDATLGTSTSWSQVATDVKSTGGVALVHHMRTDAILDS